ncbi:APC family permease [Anthocerotibacter panamensis]|uniref:hypothetical protein n=1 Tax=Anthocerotibacter panamensis TaxID=2857077 RepID=UPI001C40744D|nr:hypothetical protein [Anthocerotibacter panamensis]
MQSPPLKTIPLLPVEANSQPTDPLGKWLKKGGPQGGHHHEGETKPWYAVFWLTGVDYFSTLGYQPGIALLAAGAISPLATLLLILVTLGGALPVYMQVARRSFIGQGSIAMLEKLIPGWGGKLFVLALLGFASTDFIITMTLSASDAAEHVVHNPFLEPYFAAFPIPITLFLLTVLAVVFLLGFSEAVGVAVIVGVPYILLNIVVLVRSFSEIAQHPEAFANWQTALALKGDWTALLIFAGLTFPKLALGLSGFETGVSVMPQVKGDPEDITAAVPEGRVRGTRSLLISAAVLMSGLLMTSSFVTTLLIPASDYAEGGAASGRALSYLGHRLLGDVFGSVYDLSTIAILWFAGASAMAGMLNLIPRYLPRFGMVPAWVNYNRPLVLVLLAINFLVTMIFKADVEAQGGAYATGVLALIVSASVAVSLALGREARETGSGKLRLLNRYFWVVTAVFTYTFLENIRERPDGIIIATIFIAAILIIGGVSRWQRSTELRVEQVALADDPTIEIWPELRQRRVCLVPLISNDPVSRARKREQICKYYNVKGPFAFMHVTLRDDRSDFLSGLRVQVRRNGEDYTVEVEGAVALANAIAYLSELIDPISLFLGLTRKNMASQSWQYILFGEGETGIMVYQILVRYWEWTDEDDIRPRIFLMSD